MSFISSIYENLPCFYAKETTSILYRLMNSFSDSLETFSDNADYMKLQLYVETASGDSLDRIGALYNLPRFPGEGDDNYRSRIRSFIPGYLGGGTFEAITTNVRNRWGWDVAVTDINVNPYLPKMKVQIILNDNYPGLFSYITMPEVYLYIATIKAAGVGFYVLFVKSGGETIEITEPGAPTFTDSPLIECFYDCPGPECVYDGNCMYGYIVIYDGGFGYDSGWAYAGVSGLAFWDGALTTWDGSLWN